MPKKQLSPHEAFLNNISDARLLVGYAKAFSNNRHRKMRQELRFRVGNALKIPAGTRAKMDCLESNDLFVVMKPSGSLTRNQFSDLQPLLRQSVVVACAAFETYLADKAMEFVGSNLRSGNIPNRMKEINLTVGHWAAIEEYDRRGWGIRRIIEEHLREQSSAAPNNIGLVLSTIGVKSWATKVDSVRGVSKNTTVNQMQEIAERRNLIAHGADKKARGSRQINAKLEEVQAEIAIIEEVADAIEKVLGQPQ